jgi:hypothetical protein
MKQSTLQEQYNLITEGKGNQEVFLKEAKRQFPNLIRNSADLNETVNSLKHNHIISENNLRMGLVVTDKNTTPDWFKIFNENIQEAKAEEKKPTKEVVDMETAGFDYKDPKNIDNVFGEEFLRGYYTEMKDPKNSEKTVDELKEIVAKNLAKDRTHYVKDGQFGIKGVGYTDKAPGLGIPKEAKGKHKSSGYGDLDKKLVKESYETSTSTTFKSENEAYKKLKGSEFQELANFVNKEKQAKLSKFYFTGIAFSELPHDLFNTVTKFLKTKNYLKENQPTRSVGSMVKPEGFQVGDKVKYKGMNHEITRIIDDRIYIKNLRYGRRPDTWVKAVDLKENNENTYQDVEQSLISAPLKTTAMGGGYGPFVKIGSNTWKNPKTKSLSTSQSLASQIGTFSDFIMNSPQDVESSFKQAGKRGEFDMRGINEQEPSLTQPNKPKSNEFSVVHYNGEVAILKDKNGKLYSFVYDFVPREDFAEYAEIPKTYIGKDEDGFPEYEYEDTWEIDGAVLYGYINDNTTGFSRGIGMDGYDVGKDIVEIDYELKDYLLKIYNKDKELADELKTIAEKMVKESKDFDGTGLVVVGRTPLDNNAIQDMLDETDYYGVFNTREGYWFLPEEESFLDALEMELEKEFSERGINARFESQLDENKNNMKLNETTTKSISLEKMINEVEYYLSHKEEKKKKKKEVKEEKPLVGDKIKEIEEKGTIAALESKIAALDEEIDNRNIKLKMIGENEDLADFINPSKINELKREIKELEKAKNKYQKVYEKATRKNKKEIIDEKETE